MNASNRETAEMFSSMTDEDRSIVTEKMTIDEYRMYVGNSIMTPNQHNGAGGQNGVVDIAWWKDMINLKIKSGEADEITAVY